jgi:hypothetical protein
MMMGGTRDIARSEKIKGDAPVYDEDALIVTEGTNMTESTWTPVFGEFAEALNELCRSRHALAEAIEELIRYDREEVHDSLHRSSKTLWQRSKELESKTLDKEQHSCCL